MKAQINEHGELKVTAETQIEAFALIKWSDIYFKYDHDEGKQVIKNSVTLTIDWPSFDEYTGLPE